MEKAVSRKSVSHQADSGISRDMAERRSMGADIPNSDAGVKHLKFPFLARYSLDEPFITLWIITPDHLSKCHYPFLGLIINSAIISLLQRSRLDLHGPDF